MGAAETTWGIVHVALCAATAAGCVRILRAGRLEGAGLLPQARRRARSGGFLAAGGALAATVSWLGRELLVPRDAPPATAVILLLGMLSGLVALLAGLSGKPRPSGWFAAALCLAWLVLTAQALTGG